MPKKGPPKGTPSVIGPYMTALTNSGLQGGALLRQAWANYYAANPHVVRGQSKISKRKYPCKVQYPTHFMQSYCPPGIDEYTKWAAKRPGRCLGPGLLKKPGVCKEYTKMALKAYYRQPKTARPMRRKKGFIGPMPMYVVQG